MPKSSAAKKRKVFTLEDKKSIIERLQNGERQIDLASEFGIAKSTIGTIWPSAGDDEKLVLKSTVIKETLTKWNEVQTIFKEQHPNNIQVQQALDVLDSVCGRHLTAILKSREKQSTIKSFFSPDKAVPSMDQAGPSGHKSQPCKRANDSKTNRQGAAGVSRVNVTSKIVGGEIASQGQFPYQVSLQTIKNRQHFCGGAIYNENFVVTAAHCCGQKASLFVVVAGATDLDKDILTTAQVIPVRRRIKHPKYL
ncbi:unnamed protein product [Notodromas monacha]|uniref:Peptidase S1 domain-containing protein n=1 Tax=Notodromas monacha TaxID=399045 RepID=A0A7R9BSL0_9CRUS|nr:unnamed protein product [Notodromas monacha]CAG0919565.1 unnamed protein product [Notodromas monacha]